MPRVGYNGGTPGLLQLTGPSSAATPVASALMKTGEAAALAAAAAASGAGKALLPMFDKLATSLIGDNPALLEDLRRTQQAAQAAAMENYSLREENARLREELAAAQGPAEALAGADGGRAAASDWERAANAERCEGRSGEDIRSLADALQAAAGTPLSSPGGGGDGKKQQTKSRAAKKAD